MFAAQADVNELERLVSEYQQIEDDEQGDLLDDFVLSATLVCFEPEIDNRYCSCLLHLLSNAALLSHPFQSLHIYLFTYLHLITPI